MVKTVLFAITLCVLTSVVGCNATEGVGKDLEQTGKNVQETVEKNR